MVLLSQCYEYYFLNSIHLALIGYYTLYTLKKCKNVQKIFAHIWGFYDSKRIKYLKALLPQKFLKCFLLLCSMVNLSKQNIYALFVILKQFSVFYHSILDAPFFYLVE